jgi:hypothetical protein
MKKYRILLLAPYSVMGMISLILLAIVATLVGTRIMIPGPGSFNVFSIQLLAPIYLIFLFQNKDATFFVSTLHDLVHKILILIFAFISIVSHFTLKKMALIWSPDKYDTTYAQMDVYFHSVISAFKILTVAPLFNDDGAHYHLLFFSLFWVALLSTYMFSYRAFVLCLTMVSFNFLVGGLTYFIAPAYGPFVLHAPFSPYFNEMLAYMKYVSSQIEATGGKTMNSDFFFYGLAAMPSLHITQTACLFWATLKLPGSRIKAVIVAFFIYATSYITIWSVLSGFHYVIDLVFGLILAIISIVISEYLCNQHLRNLSRVLHPSTAI